MVQYSVEIAFPNCTLIYDLFDHPFVEKWAKVFQEEFQNKKVAINNQGDFYGSGWLSASDLLANMQKCVDIINAYVPNSIQNKVFKDMTHHDLMLLHKDFEDLEPNPLYRTPHASSKVIHALTELNIFIHQYESINAPPLCHIDISPRPVNRYQFEDEDYKYFVKHIEKGFLYLPYGVTGVPPMTAYSHRMTSLPVPQSNFTAGLSLYFVDISRNVDLNHMREWFSKHWNMDIDDPKNSLGYIPLGKLRHIEKIQEYTEKIVLDRKIISIRVLPNPDMTDFEATIHPLDPPDEKPQKNFKPIIEATWPAGKEFFQHLELNPYVMLPIQFNHKACLQEAQNLLDQFVVHRAYDQSSTTTGKWKSLAIQGLNGDSHKTQNHFDYGVSEPTYQLTEIASRCPETIKFLESITDLSKCERIRFMLLEPGAKIAVHSDAEDKDVTIATNIALNMPTGCEFWTDLNKDGRKNLFSQKIPIQDGSVFIFNNAPYHMVENNSNQNRIHIIIHGPLRFEQSRYLATARIQNSIFTEKILLNHLLFKKKFLKKSISNQLGNEWLSCGVDKDYFHPAVSLAFLEDLQLPEEVRHDALNLITKGSFFPLKAETIRFTGVDEWLNQQKQSGKKFAILIGMGLYSLSHKEFYWAVAEALGDLENSDAAMMGQIINRPTTYEDGKTLPFIHEQLMLINLDKWQQLQPTKLGFPYIGTEVEFPEFEASEQTFHDDYTPLWIKPGVHTKSRRGRAGWGTEFMAKALMSGHSIINVPINLRRAKAFSYPHAPKGEQYAEIKKAISKFLTNCLDRVFVFNNESLKIYGMDDFKPDLLISVSSGFKPFALINQFWPTENPKKIVLVDYSERSLQHLKNVINAKDIEDLIQILALEYKKQYATDDHVEAVSVVKNQLETIIKENFEGEYSRLQRTFDLCKKADFLQTNFIGNHDVILNHVQTDQKVLFWHSNAWDCNPTYFTMSAEQALANYESLIQKVAKKLNANYWLASVGQIGRVGSAINSIQACFTDGLELKPEFSKTSFGTNSIAENLHDYNYKYPFKAVYLNKDNLVSLSFKINDQLVQTFYSESKFLSKMFAEYKDNGFFNERPILVQFKNHFIRFTYYTSVGYEFNFRFSLAQWNSWHEQHLDYMKNKVAYEKKPFHLNVI